MNSNSNGLASLVRTRRKGKAARTAAADRARALSPQRSQAADAAVDDDEDLCDYSQPAGRPVDAREFMRRCSDPMSRFLRLKP